MVRTPSGETVTARDGEGSAGGIGPSPPFFFSHANTDRARRQARAIERLARVIARSPLGREARRRRTHGTLLLVVGERIGPVLELQDPELGEPLALALRQEIHLLDRGD